MTRLDHAFIKIYAERGAASPAPPAPHLPGTAESPPGEPTPRETVEVPAAGSVDNVSKALQETTSRIGNSLPPEKITPTPRGAGAGPGVCGTGVTPVAPTGGTPHARAVLVQTESISAGGDKLEAAAGPGEPHKPATVHRVDPGPQSGSTTWPPTGGTPVPLGRPIRPPHMRLPRTVSQAGAGGAAVAPASQNAAVAPASQNKSIGDDLGGKTFQPMLQVDQFAWPAVCCRLGEAAADELDRLADALVQLMARGKRVVAIGGCRRGEGATTVLLCAGRRLAELGLNLVLADAHLADPQLACRLGLQPESGWEDVLTGRLPLEEAVIESAGDRLAVLPLRPVALASRQWDASGVAEDETRLVESIRTLAAHYDLVLLDPGPLEELGVVGASLACGIGSRLDAIVLVHHGGVTPPEDLDEVRRRLAATEIVQVGVIENFCSTGFQPVTDGQD